MDAVHKTPWGILVMMATLLGLGPGGGAARAQAEEEPFVQAVAHVRPSVLAVGSYDPKDTPSVKYLGTGFVVDDGRVLVTNAHVIAALREQKLEEHLRVFLPDLIDADGRPLAGRVVEGRGARCVAEDRHHDLALVEFDGRPLAALELADEPPPPGRSVGVVGYPLGTALGLVPAAHKGVVAAVVPAVLPLPKGAKLTPELAAALADPYNLYQLDLVVYPGNSGSPLIDARDGRVLGVINKTLADRTREHLLTQPSGVSYAVPVRWVKALLRQWHATGAAAAGSGTAAGGGAAAAGETQLQ